jgi:S-adenosylmethionine:tRNA ribosyltransferase-isomerase
VLNRSRVFPARLVGERRGGGAAEIFLLRPIAGCVWEALVRPARRLRPGDSVSLAGGLSLIIASGPKAEDARREVRFECEASEVAAWIARVGRTPLPPYIRRSAGDRDRDRYQTVYANESGSVAAPTAGLHFTAALLDRLRTEGIETAEVVLHVGPGTFKPVHVDDVREHQVAAEPFVLPAETVEAIRRTRERGGRVIAVGTTTVRTLESAAQDDRSVRAGEGETDLVVAPGFSFRVVDGLITNFHLPRSSLLLLVSAFAGRERILGAYQEAVRAGYRFYSYGDAMLIT